MCVIFLLIYKTMSYIYDYKYWEDGSVKANLLNDVIVDELSHKNIEQKRFSDSVETEKLLQMLNNEE